VILSTVTSSIALPLAADADALQLLLKLGDATTAGTSDPSLFSTIAKTCVTSTSTVAEVALLEVVVVVLDSSTIVVVVDVPSMISEKCVVDVVVVVCTLCTLVVLMELDVDAGDDL
jgi:hypothetical protein